MSDVTFTLCSPLLVSSAIVMLKEHCGAHPTSMKWKNTSDLCIVKHDPSCTCPVQAIVKHCGCFKMSCMAHASGPFSSHQDSHTAHLEKLLFNPAWCSVDHAMCGVSFT